MLIPVEQVPCWSCHRPLAVRALYCHGCGTLQPAHPVDPFARLNLERRFDLDLAVVERQHAGLRRAVEPERHAARGEREQAHARTHVEALDAARAALKDPVSRARWLLTLAGHDHADDVGHDAHDHFHDKARHGEAANDDADGARADDTVDGVRRTLAETDDAGAIDQLANRLAHEVEHCIHALAVAFREDALGRACALVTRLTTLGDLIAFARERRMALARPTG